GGAGGDAQAVDTRHVLDPQTLTISSRAPDRKDSTPQTGDCCIHPPGRNEMIARSRRRKFFQGGSPKQATHFPARTSSPPEIVSDQISGDGAWMNFRFSRALPPGASRSRRDERHSIRWTLPGRTTYLPRPWGLKL